MVIVLVLDLVQVYLVLFLVQVHLLKFVINLDVVVEAVTTTTLLVTADLLAVVMTPLIMEIPVLVQEAKGTQGEDMGGGD